MTDPYGPPPQDPYAPQPPTPPTNPYAQTPPMSPVPPPTSGAPQYGQPVSGTPQYGQPAYGQPQQPYGYAAAPPQNSMALVSMILSLVGLLSWITAPIGAILGHIALKQIRETGESGEGMAKAGIIVGWIVTGLGLLGCCALIALPIIAASAAGAGG